MKPPITVAIVGAGHRSVIYGSYAKSHPKRMKVVAVADPVAERRAAVAAEHGLAESACFNSYQELAERPRLADAVINGTMDQVHYASSMPLLKRGYHMLLEKPIAQSERDVRELIDTARANKLTVMICHVLRYAPFYGTIKRLLDEGAIGQTLQLRAAEHVCWHHIAVSFVRGRWNKRSANPMLLAKCCHDLDIIAWLLSGNRPMRVSSFGSLRYFRRENAPANSGERCTDCAIEKDCLYSAVADYIRRDKWDFYAWESIQQIKNPTEADKLHSLATDNPMGRCVWKCDNDVVDHQTLIAEFADGTTASFDMIGNSARSTRTIHITGTTGEISGDLEKGQIIVRTPCTTDRRRDSDERMIDIDVKDDMHGGGDLKLVEDFVSVLRGEAASSGVTRIEDSLTGHQLAFAADVAMRERRVVEVG